MWTDDKDGSVLREEHATGGERHHPTRRGPGENHLCRDRRRLPDAGAHFIWFLWGLSTFKP